MTLIVRSNNGGASGIDWRVVAALVGVILSLGALTAGLLQERIVVLAHVAKAEAMIIPVQRHIDNIGDHRHPSFDDAKLVASLPWQMEEIRRDLTAIKRKLKISDDDLRIGGIP